MKKKKKETAGITLRAFLLGTLFAGLFAVLTTVLDNRQATYVAANQVPLFPYTLLLVMALLVNPLCRLLRVARVFSRAEILIIFIMGMVPSGIASFGLTGELVPLAGSLFNRHWNNDQTEWRLYAEPFLNEHFFVSEPGIRQAAAEYREALLQAARAETKDDAEQARRQAALDARKQALESLEARAFAKVELFRRGLPRDLRAFPGFLPVVQQDNARSYFGRLRRLVVGKRAAWQAREAVRLLRAAAGETAAAWETEKAAALAASAAETLRPAGLATGLAAELDELRGQDAALVGRLNAVNAQLVELNAERRRQDAEAARRMEGPIEALRDQRLKLEEARRDAAFGIEKTSAEIGAAERVAAAAAALDGVHEDLIGGTAPTAAAARIEEILKAFPAFDASLRRYFLGDVPWSHWAGALWRWGLLIGMTYAVLMTFNVLIFRQWAYHEKLIYPLAELPEELAGNDDGRLIPETYASGLFWAGFAVSASILGWNLLCRAGALPGMSGLNLDNDWYEYTVNTPFAGIGSIGRSSIFFTMIGLAFLIPKKVSFSLWFFWVLAMVQLQILVWAGYGQGEGSFPSEWWYTLNFRTSEGGGALLVFASVAMFKSRRYLLCALRPSAVGDLPADESRELRVSSLLFLACSAGIVLMLWRGLRIDIAYAIFGYAFMMVVTVGLVRAGAEGGILSYKAYFGPFHFIRSTFGFDRAWTSPSLMAPLMVYYSVLLLDIKAFIAPAMASAVKIRSDLGLKRARFHAAIAVCILTATVMSVVAALIMAYASGADGMSGWFYTGFPRGLFDRISAISKTPPTATPEGRFWMTFGAVAMAALLFFRQRMFWLPHPIGMIMLVNPIMRTFWFSIFIGWIAKTLATRYGNKDTYKRLRGLFIGLIVGELVIVAIATVVSLVLNKRLGIDLNRN